MAIVPVERIFLAKVWILEISLCRVYETIDTYVELVLIVVKIRIDFRGHGKVRRKTWKFNISKDLFSRKATLVVPDTRRLSIESISKRWLIFSFFFFMDLKVYWIRSRSSGRHKIGNLTQEKVSFGFFETLKIWLPGLR